MHYTYNSILTKNKDNKPKFGQNKSYILKFAKNC